MIGPIALIIILTIPIGPLSGGLGILQPWGGIFDVGRGLNEPINQTLTLPGLEDEVVILIDEYGVPHIYASNAVDAYVGLGYMHAKDRLFQMVIQNRLASGRVSEIVGGYANSSDKIYRTIGLKRAAQASLDAALDVDAREPAIIGRIAHWAKDLGRQHDLIAHAAFLDPAADDLFGYACRVLVCGIQKGAAQLHKAVHQREGGSLVCARAKGHSAQANGGDFKICVRYFTSVHYDYPLVATFR